jgi:hypothetical protein
VPGGWGQGHLGVATCRAGACHRNRDGLARSRSSAPAGFDRALQPVWSVDVPDGVTPMKSVPVSVTLA